MKTRYAVVGVGFRGLKMYIEPLINEYKDVAELIALCDRNSLRAQVANNRLNMELPIYNNFEEMLNIEKVDKVIITTPDSTHKEFIIKALERGKDVICEKPLATDAEKCQEILDAEKRTGKKVTVTFNVRFNPYLTKVKELLKQGILGRVFSINYQSYLDTLHGADYYRRWHAQLENSGGLLVHKATHQFDLINWLLEMEPKRVFALGKLGFYGDNRSQRGERCLTCGIAERCEFFLDLRNDPDLKELYLDTEDGDGYIRDRCVFDQRIDIHDTMSTVVEYSDGTQMCFSLHSFAPFEGWRMSINGEKGRLELSKASSFYLENRPNFAERTAIVTALDPIRVAFGINEDENNDIIRFYPLYGGMEVIKVPRVKGGHGGADERLREMLFRGYHKDPLGHMADSWAGAMSLLMGVASNQSIKTGKTIEIDDLIKRRS